MAAPVSHEIPTRSLCAVYPPNDLCQKRKGKDGEKGRSHGLNRWGRSHNTYILIYVIYTKMKKKVSLRMLSIAAALVIAATMTFHYSFLRIEDRATGKARRRSVESSASDSEVEQNKLQSCGGVDTSKVLLAIAVGINQKQDVDVIVCRFVSENYSVMLFHYDGNMEGWDDLEWSRKVIHVVALNQTKWWFAKRFLHPDVVSIYDYIFLWDEDLGMENFHPRRYLQIVFSEKLQISQPALDPKSAEIHHRITVRKSTKKVHRRVYDFRGSLNICSTPIGPPCSGWVEGMAPVFSRRAWMCVWHLIQNDLIHGWGLDMKFGYCAQGDPSKNVGIVDAEFVLHKGVPSLGGGSSSPIDHHHRKKKKKKKMNSRSIDLRTLVRRQSTAELIKFKRRWEHAVSQDTEWNDPYLGGGLNH